jgi:hypothetical protein
VGSGFVIKVLTLGVRLAFLREGAPQTQNPDMAGKPPCSADALSPFSWKISELQPGRIAQFQEDFCRKKPQG